MGDHKRGEAKGKFCGVPGTPCSCGNDYIDICKPDWGDWTFPRKVNAKDGAFTFKKKYEAHHLLCVSPVATQLAARAKIDAVIRATKWCINNKDNMLGMPLWGHTVMWYCNISDTGGSIAAELIPPPFQDVPQHDWDHNCNGGFTDEVETALKDVAKDVEDAGHEADAESIASALNNLSSEFRSKLAERGKRPAGTHAGWTTGMADPSSYWYGSFSMASTAWITKKGFPVRRFDQSVKEWIQRIAQAIATGN